MPTIEELFRSKKLSSGKTAEQEYAVRNSKDNELDMFYLNYEMEINKINFVNKPENVV